MKSYEIDSQMLDCGIDPHFYNEQEKLLILQYAEAISKNTYSLPKGDLFSKSRANDLSKIENNAKEITLKYNVLKENIIKAINRYSKLYTDGVFFSFGNRNAKKITKEYLLFISELNKFKSGTEYLMHNASLLNDKLSNLRNDCDDFFKDIIIQKSALLICKEQNFIKKLTSEKERVEALGDTVKKSQEKILIIAKKLNDLTNRLIPHFIDSSSKAIDLQNNCERPSVYELINSINSFFAILSNTVL